MGIRDTSEKAHTIKYFVFYQKKGHVGLWVFLWNANIPRHTDRKTQTQFCIAKYYLDVLITYHKSFSTSIYSDFSHFLLPEM